jgi:hypothetical protein
MTPPLVGLQTGKVYDNRPLIRRETNNDINAREEAQRQVETIQNSPIISSLAGHVRSAFQTATLDRSVVSERLLRCLRQREGKYDADTQKLIDQSNGTNLYMMLTDIKCRALESWLKDIMIPSGERPYSIEPTPVPEVPQQIIGKAQQAFMQDYLGRIQAQAAQAGQEFNESMIDPEDLQEAAGQFEKELLKIIREQAKEAADSLEVFVDDELREGNWYKVLSEFLIDFSTYPTAFMEGPIFRRRQVMVWEPVEGSLKSELRIVDKVVKEYERIRPFDVYPSPGSKSLQDGNLCIRKKFSRSDLDALRGVDGFDADVINLVLKQYANGYREFIAYDTEVEDLHDRPSETSDPEGHIDGIKFFGNVQGFMLREWGMSIKQIPDPFREYPVVAYLIGSYIIGARINPHPLGRRNIYSASFRRKNDSVWGKGVPELMHDIQQLCNSTARAICNNEAIASGPQVWQYADLIPAECDKENIYPWKIWQFSSEKVKSAGQRPMEFYQPTLIVGELLRVYDYFFKQASEVTGIPAYIYGNESIGGAGSTASGLSMLMNAASKGLRNAASNIDEGVISPSVEEHWLTVMLMRPDLARGDSKIIARASEYLVQQEALQMRRTEFLNATNNEIDMQITGVDGRRELLRENAKSLKINPDKVVPTREDMIATQVEEQIKQVIGKLSAVLNVPPEQLIAALQAPVPKPGAGGQQQPKPQELDAAGNPVAGQDVRQFNQ